MSRNQVFFSSKAETCCSSELLRMIKRSQSATFGKFGEYIDRSLRKENEEAGHFRVDLMQTTHRKTSVVFALSFCLALWLRPLFGETSEITPDAPVSRHGDDIESYRVRTGTLEIVRPEVYIFRSGAEVEEFDVSLLGRARESGVPEFGLHGPRGLKEIGFRAAIGGIQEYGNSWAGKVIDDFLKKNPQDKIVSLIFESKGGQRVEIRGEGKTPVYRVDLRIDGRLVVLWSNISSEMKKKDEKDNKKK